MPAEQSPRNCVECGQPVVLSPRSKTCSEACRKAHKKKVKHALYERSKDTEHFKAQQAKHVAQHKAQRAKDPEFDAQAAAAHKKAVQKSVAKRNEDPERRSAHLEKMRHWQWLAAGEQREKMREASRRWYANLSPAAKAEYISAQVERRKKRNLEP